ncbi:hypothetical protein RvY_04420 [Ramazzottius varieornatus]|uniref:SET domain-containing protein n=1 Tax=Ramazzottius varieornatus TaxID=947166 RepID=A0A1D1URM3_RAMVA|nr:hypothetical protein RvY_04420 [Ramazzottius varieornatus]
MCNVELPTNRVLCIYAGELIDKDMKERRQREMGRGHVRIKQMTDGTLTDAEIVRNFGAEMNHAHDPVANCTAEEFSLHQTSDVKVKTSRNRNAKKKNLERDIKVSLIKTNRPIPARTELTWNYGNDAENIFGGAVCLCAAPKCVVAQAALNSQKP